MSVDAVGRRFTRTAWGRRDSLERDKPGICGGVDQLEDALFIERPGTLGVRALDIVEVVVLQCAANAAAGTAVTDLGSVYATRVGLGECPFFVVEVVIADNALAHVAFLGSFSLHSFDVDEGMWDEEGARWW